MVKAEFEIKRRLHLQKIKAEEEEKLRKENLLIDPLEKLNRLPNIRLQKIVKKEQIKTLQVITIPAPVPPHPSASVQNALTRLSGSGVTLKKMSTIDTNGTMTTNVIKTYSRTAKQQTTQPPPSLPSSPTRSDLKRKVRDSPKKVIKTEEVSPEIDDPKDTDYDPTSVRNTKVSTPKKRRLITRAGSVTAVTTQNQTNESLVVNISPGPVYVCTCCRDRFNTFEELKTHMSENTKCKYANTTCNVCGKVYENRKQLYSHSQSHKKSIHTCPDCHKTYSNKYSLENHRASVHGVELDVIEGLVYQCRICEKSFKSRKELFPHVYTHTNGKDDDDLAGIDPKRTPPHKVFIKISKYFVHIKTEPPSSPPPPL